MSSRDNRAYTEDSDSEDSSDEKRRSRNHGRRRSGSPNEDRRGSRDDRHERRRRGSGSPHHERRRGGHREDSDRHRGNHRENHSEGRRSGSPRRSDHHREDSYEGRKKDRHKKNHSGRRRSSPPRHRNSHDHNRPRDRRDEDRSRKSHHDDRHVRDHERRKRRSPSPEPERRRRSPSPRRHKDNDQRENGGHRRSRDNSPIDKQPQQNGNRRKSEFEEAQGCPDLGCLDRVQEITVHETVEIMEVFSGIETNNKFRIKNSAGQQLYFAGEETDYCTRRLCGSRRRFEMHIADTTGKEVMRVKRKFRCFGGCCCLACLPCCSWDARVYAPSKTCIGYVRQAWSIMRSCFNVCDRDGNDLMYITGPFCIWDCCCFQPKFHVTDAETGDPVGSIKKMWTEDRDDFNIQFNDENLDRKKKALLLGAVFLINMMHFNSESEKRDEKKREKLKKSGNNKT